MIIAIDFDGTIVEDDFPGIGEEIIFAFQTMKQLQKEGHQLILWTFRHGEALDDAVEHCLKNGIKFYAVNKSFPEEKFDDHIVSRKIKADIYIDDRNIGGMIGWGEIWNLLNPMSGKKEDQYINYGAHTNYKKKQSLWKKILFRRK